MNECKPPADDCVAVEGHAEAAILLAAKPAAAAALAAHLWGLGDAVLVRSTRDLSTALPRAASVLDGLRRPAGHARFDLSAAHEGERERLVRGALVWRVCGRWRGRAAARVGVALRVPSEG